MSVETAPLPRRGSWRAPQILACKKNKNWACKSNAKLQKVNDECGAGACSTDLQAAEICIIEAMIHDFYASSRRLDLRCVVPPSYLSEDCKKSSDSACRTTAAGVAAMVAAFAAL